MLINNAIFFKREKGATNYLHENNADGHSIKI